MTPTATFNPAWRTASNGLAANTSALELSALGDHLNVCKVPGGRLFALYCAADRMQGFVATRLFTTLVLVSFLIGAGSMVL